jgi:hypothetical protein
MRTGHCEETGCCPSSHWIAERNARQKPTRKSEGIRHPGSIFGLRDYRLFVIQNRLDRVREFLVDYFYIIAKFNINVTILILFLVSTYYQDYIAIIVKISCQTKKIYS